MGYYLSRALSVLGASRHESIETMLAAYDQQKACDAQNIPKYLGALQEISNGLHSPSELAYKIALERSLGHYTDSEYNLVKRSRC